MKRIKTISHAIFVMFILSLSATCGQEDLDILTPMEKVELEALYSTIESFLGDSWNSSDLYPDPCGWTPIQVPFSFLYIFSFHNLRKLNSPLTLDE